MAYLVAVLSLCATSIVSTSGISNEVLTANRERRSIGELTDSKPPLEEVASGGDLSTHSSHNEGLQIQDNLRNLPELSIFKRAPVGFMGMRGKKDYEYSDFSSQDGADPSGKLVYSNLKRAPYGFVGMRGKKFNDNRVPMEFLGLGNKKEFSDLDHYEDLDEASYLQDELHNLYDSEDDHIPEWSSRPISKRAPAAGFFGMRGKKTYEGYSYDANGKRAPTGFMGMRGKKSFNQLYDGAEEEKRDPKGFFGMRGKKFNTPQYEEKRSLAQFFGIRGKKQPFNSGFFGMRGKKEPFEFRGKFVGVRGKKIPEGSLERLESELSDITGNGMNVINQISPEGYAAKRVPSGFVGMRGKKGASDTSSTEE